eukprot:scaffold245_cov256-Pinguiococcus_pyrenoidosus.AAC.44
MAHPPLSCASLSLGSGQHDLNRRSTTGTLTAHAEAAIHGGYKFVYDVEAEPRARNVGVGVLAVGPTRPTDSPS